MADQSSRAHRGAAYALDPRLFRPVIFPVGAASVDLASTGAAIEFASFSAARREYIGAAMRESFEANITDSVAISAFDGHRRISPGRYRVNILHDERGDPAGAELMRIDVEGPPWPIRFTAAQWG